MKVGIVGTGAMGQTHAASWQALGVPIGGIVSGTLAAAEEMAAVVGGRACATVAELCEHVDVIDICTPTHLHHEMVLTAARLGKDIICEKPLARSVAQAEEMVTACEQHGVELLVAHVVRYFPEYAAAQEQVASGTIGTPAVLRLSRGGFRPKPAWFHDQALAGGMLLDMMIHDFDYARWIAGDVVRVFAKNISSNYPDAPVDHGLVILTHASGAISHVEGSWAYPPPTFRTRFEIAGDNGLITHDSEKTRAIISYHHVQENDTVDVPLPSSPLAESPYTTQLRAFRDHLLHGTPLRVTADDGVQALTIALAALQSAVSGEAVTL